MNTEELANACAKKIKCDPAVALAVIGAIKSVSKQVLIKGGTVKVGGLGTLEAVAARPRRYRNITTGVVETSKRRLVVKMRLARTMKNF